MCGAVSPQWEVTISMHLSPPCQLRQLRWVPRSEIRPVVIPISPNPNLLCTGPVCRSPRGLLPPSTVGYISTPLSVYDVLYACPLSPVSWHQNSSFSGCANSFDGSKFPLGENRRVYVGGCSSQGCRPRCPIPISLPPARLSHPCFRVAAYLLPYLSS